METLRKDVHMLPYDWLVGIGTMGAGVEGPIRNFAIGKIFCLWNTLGNDMLHLHRGVLKFDRKAGGSPLLDREKQCFAKGEEEGC